MKRRSIKILAGAMIAAALTSVFGATAWADSFTPAIEEPTAELGFPGGAALPGGPSDGNYSSAQGRNGRSDGHSFGDDPSVESDSSPDDPSADRGSSRSLRGHGSAGSADDYSSGSLDGDSDGSSDPSADGS